MKLWPCEAPNSENATLTFCELHLGLTWLPSLFPRFQTILNRYELPTSNHHDYSQQLTIAYSQPPVKTSSRPPVPCLWFPGAFLT